MKNNKEKISRKKAIKKLGKYAGLTAIGTILLLSPNKSAASSSPVTPGTGW